MGIYSPNRMGGSMTIQANENYAPVDIGMIMYESARNDMAIFEATLKSDFMEIKGIQEGTLLESELSALNEANAKSLFTSLKESLKKFWEKIKNVFKTAMAKIATALSTERALVKRFDAVKKNAPKDFEITFGIVPTDLLSSEVNIISDMVRSNVNADEVNKEDFIGMAYAKAVNESNKLSSKEFVTKAAERSFKKDYTAKGVDDEYISIMAQMLNSGKSKLIANLKNTENRANIELRNLERELVNAENAVERNKDSKSEEEKHAKILKNISILISASQTFIAQVCRTNINICKKRLSISASNIRKVVNALSGVKNEYAMLVEEAEVELAMEDVPGVEGDEVTPEIEEIINAED